MELLLGSHVREYGERVGRLAGLELEPASRRIRRIVFSADGDLGPQVVSRPPFAINHVHDNHEIELRTDIDLEVLPAVSDVFLLSRATRLKRSGHDSGRLVGVELNQASREIESVFGRRHWWSKRFMFGASGLDFSVPGEVRAVAPAASSAA
jgi:hypothetical protein